MDAENITIYINMLSIWLQIIKIRRVLLYKMGNVTRVKPHISLELRQTLGAYRKLFSYFKSRDHEEFFKYTRMSVQQFDYIHELLKHTLQKKSNREPLFTEIRLAVTLSFLAHGDSIASLSLLFRIGKSTLYIIIPEVCTAMWEVLQPLYLRCPTDENEWIKIAEDFNILWNFPNCIGAIHGKHCPIQAPAHSGSAFHNYKGYFSLILMGMVDARYRFPWVDIGDYGSLNDAGILSNTIMSRALDNNTLSIPQNRSLPNSNVVMPFSLVGDEGFPLKTYLMRPYARRNLQNNEQKIFNYRLCRARRIVENAFGILVPRWRILHKPICLKVDTAERIIQATICLHNFIISTGYDQYSNIRDREGSNGEIILGNWRNIIQPNNFVNPLGRVDANIGATAAMRQRDNLARYFVSEEGSIPWQWQHI